MPHLRRPQFTTIHRIEGGWEIELPGGQVVLRGPQAENYLTPLSDFLESLAASKPRIGPLRFQDPAYTAEKPSPLAGLTEMFFALESIGDKVQTLTVPARALPVLEGYAANHFDFETRRFWGTQVETQEAPSSNEVRLLSEKGLLCVGTWERVPPHKRPRRLYPDSGIP